MSTLDCVISYRRCAGMLLMSSWCFQVLTAGITTQFYIYLVFRNSFQNVNLISNLFIYLKITWCDSLVAMHPSTKVGTTGTLLLARLLDFWLQSNCRLKLHKLKERLHSDWQFLFEFQKNRHSTRQWLAWDGPTFAWYNNCLIKTIPKMRQWNNSNHNNSLLFTG